MSDWGSRVPRWKKACLGVELWENSWKKGIQRMELFLNEIYIYF